MSVALFRDNAPGLGAANEIVVRRLASLAPLSSRDIERVHAFPLSYRASPAQTELHAAGETTPKPRFLVQGWACRQRMLPDGRRQIFDLVLPGDLIGSCLRPQRPAPAATVALTRVETANAATFAAAVSGPAPQASAALVDACAALEEQGETLLLDQITRLGRQTAYERIAHLLLEVWYRLAVVGMVESNSFAMPLRQDTMADLVGLSVVHVNRTLQQMRRDRLIELRGGIAILLQPDRLQATADFSLPLRTATV